MMIRAIQQVIGSQCRKLDFMVALGTHTPLSQQRIVALYGIQDRRKEFSSSTFYNHDWYLKDTFRQVGTFSTGEIEELSGGLLREEVSVVINKCIFEYDLILIVGPVFPHEVAGFSGGAKYLFPGISGGEFLHFFHWLGALITCRNVIGIKDTPVRRLIHKALVKVAVPSHCLALIVAQDERLCGLYAGDMRESWSKAADLSSLLHVVTKKKPFDIVLGQAPAMYDEIWTAGKVMYKLEQVVARRGTLIIFAPHVRELSRTWGKYIEQAGYHTRDYFLDQMSRFTEIPRGVLAHLTHLKGTGSYRNGVEVPDISVVLATSIPEETCRRINLGYRDPDTIKISDYTEREDEGILYVDQAGETLYRLEDGF